MDYKIFGCKVNKYYLNKRLNYFQQISSDNENKFIIATCEVTDRAKSKWLKEAQRVLGDGKEVYITGCGTLKRGEMIDESEFYSIYPELLAFKSQIVLLGEAPLNEQGKMNNEQCVTNIYTKKFVVIQNGCDNHCSFCLTVKKRGKHMSLSSEDIIEEIKRSEENGTKEIVLTGVNLVAWGCSDSQKPEETKFSSLLKEILNQTTIPRIRISSLAPEYLNDDFFEIIKDPRILPHFHISIQSFSDDVLKNMRRNYDKKTLKDILGKIRKRREHISIGADIIVGFPGESEEDFQETLDGIKEFGITKVHSFPFSAHEKGETVPAGQFDNQITQDEKKSRVNKILKVGNKVRKDFISQNIGKKHQVLIEEFKNGKWYGRTENYIQVALGGDYVRGEIIEIVLNEKLLTG